MDVVGFIISGYRIIGYSAAFGSLRLGVQVPLPRQKENYEEVLAEIN